jgi:hypothetical protein
MTITHDLPLRRRSLHGHFSRVLEPVLSIDPGDSVRFQALDAGWHWDLEREWIDSRDPLLDDGHALCGPIEVRGARAGGDAGGRGRSGAAARLGYHVRRRDIGCVAPGPSRARRMTASWWRWRRFWA